jgi:hypothetical protein
VPATRRALALLASSAVVAVAATGTGEAHGHVAKVDWCRTKDAGWVGRVVDAAGYSKTSCAGAAYLIGSRGRDLYVWATSEPGVVSDQGKRVRIAGVVVRYGRVRAAWRTHRRRVWVEAGPTTARLWPAWRLRKLVCASVATR